METADQSLKLRVASCQQLIHDVSQRLSDEDIHPNIKKQLTKLDDLLALIDHDLVTANDLDRIESSTNALMKELRLVFNHMSISTLYKATNH